MNFLLQFPWSTDQCGQRGVWWPNRTKGSKKPDSTGDSVPPSPKTAAAWPPAGLLAPLLVCAEERPIPALLGRPDPSEPQS
jgi:hypothetical protein